MLGSVVADAAAFGVLGLLIGSFLNVVIHRFPKMLEAEWADNCAELAGKEGWRFDELRTEEGRLDDVFRAITQPDTRRQGA